MRAFGRPVLFSLIPILLMEHALGGYQPDAPAPGPAGTGGPSEAATYLFVQGAQNAVVKLKNASDLSAGALLTLQGVDDNTIWFTNYPVRKAGRVKTSKLAETDEFWSNLPNAALVGKLPGRNDSSTVVVTLMDPVVNSTAREIAYDVNLITPEGQHLSVNRTSQDSYILQDEDSGLTLVRWNQSSTVELTDVTLFIDNFCWNGLVFSGCWDGHGDNVWRVGAGPFGFGGSNCPNCYQGGGYPGGGYPGGGYPGGGYPQGNNQPGCWDQWGKWHYQGEPYGYCDWQKNIWVYTS